MRNLRPYAGYLADELAALDFTDLDCDPEELGGHDAVYTRVWRTTGVQVEIHEQTGDTEIRLFDATDTSDDAHTHGHIATTTYTSEWPYTLIVAAITAAAAYSSEAAARAARLAA